MDVDKYKIRSWSKDDFATLAKYLNNPKIRNYHPIHD